jgi:hypothetical protein
VTEARESLLPRMTLRDCVELCQHFEAQARVWWDRVWLTYDTPTNVRWYQEQSAVMYAEARRLRAWVIAHPELRQ